MALADQPLQQLTADDQPLDPAAAAELGRQVPDWQVGDGSIQREVKLKNFGAAMAFVNQVAVAAEEAKHHPDIAISYNRVRLELATHKIGGLSANDFILAARIDRLLAGLASS